MHSWLIAAVVRFCPPRVARPVISAPPPTPPAPQIGVVSQPCTFSRIELGYVHTPGAVRPVEWCDLELGYHGEQGGAPADYGFSFGAGGRTYRVLVQVLETQTVFCGSDWEARLLERPCRYQLNGVRGWGMSEWQYRHEGGRPERYPLATGAAQSGEEKK